MFFLGPLRLDYVLTSLPLKRFNMETLLISLDRERFVAVHTLPTASLLRGGATAEC